MISSHERSDIIHIMKMNRFVLTDSDTAQLIFRGRANAQDYQIKILIIENQPHLTIEKDANRIFNQQVKSVDDLKIFLEEKLYKFLEV